MFFTVTMEHPDGPAWDRHVNAHVRYLEELVSAGALRASGPIKGGRLRSGFLIFDVVDRETVTRLVAADPFMAHGVMETLEIREWDPVFGAFAAQSSGTIPGGG